MWKYILGVAVFIIGLYLWRSWKSSERIFADEHFEEFAEILFDLRELALGKMKAEDGEVPGKVTSAGLAVSYSVEEENSRFKHHVAISTPGRPTPHAIGDRFIHCAIWILGLPLDRFRLESSQTRVHHGKVEISSEEQDRFVESPRRVPSKDEIKENLIRFHENPPQCHLIKVEGI